MPKRLFRFARLWIYLDVDPGPKTPVTATCLNKLSLLLLYRDAFHEAEPLMRRALEIREKIYGERRILISAASLGNLGLLDFRLGDYEEAEESLRRALGILDGLASKERGDVLSAANVRLLLGRSMPPRGDSATHEMCYNE